MEGSNQAITVIQAGILLPLWKAVSIMGSNQSASKIEVAALYAQIQETLTPDQISIIQKSTYTQVELAALVQKYGTTSSSLISSLSSSSTTNTQSGAGVSPDMGGMPGGSDILGGGDSGQTTSAQASSNVKVSQTTNSSTDLNPTFASAIINILKLRITLE